MGRCVPALEDLLRRRIRRGRPGEHQRQAEPLRREGHDADGCGSTPLNFKFEFDLFGIGADAGQTTIRLRHAYGEWGQILAGQTNTLFMDGDVFPNTIDYWGPSGMVFYRNVQIRWTPYKTDNSHFAIAIENPGNDIDSGNLRLIEGLEDLEVKNDEELPDLTAQYRFGGDWGHVQVGGILRKIGFEVRADPADPWPDGSETGWGINVGSVFNVFEQGRDPAAGRLRRRHRQLHERRRHGPRAGGGLMTRTSRPLEAEAVPLTGVLAYYDHYWSDQWSSSIGYSFTEVDNTNSRIRHVQEGRLRLGQPAVLPGRKPDGWRRADVGPAREQRRCVGDDVRFQFTFKYNFGIKL